MSRAKGATLVVAMFVLSAIGIASASAALPEFDGPFPIHFVAKQLGVGKLETIAGGNRTVECSGGSTLGFVDSPKHVLVNGIIYTGCKSKTFGGGECQSGATKGEIKSLPLLGLLGYITKTPPLVGLLFEPQGGINHFASFTCEEILGTTESLTVKGTIICDLSPVNTLTKDYHLLCSQSKGVQKPLTFEGLGTKDSLMTEGSGIENFGSEQSGVEALSDVLTLTLTLILA
jgi:hypothetical protein